MNRQQTMDALYEIAQLMAKEMELSEIETTDSDCGIWDRLGGESMSEMLRKEFGEMKDIKFHSPEKRETKYGSTYDKFVMLRFRFANPVLSVHWHNDEGAECMGSIELSDYVWKDKELVHSGDYRLSEMLSFKPEGFDMTERLMAMWREKNGQ